MAKVKREVSMSLLSPPTSEQEEYMNALQLEYFRQKLETWKRQAVERVVWNHSSYTERNS